METEKVIILLKGHRYGGAGLQVEGPFPTMRLAEVRRLALWREEWWTFYYDGCGGAPFPGLSEAERRLNLLPNRSIFWTSIKEIEVPVLDTDKLLYEDES
jgi:hypothetical protein